MSTELSPDWILELEDHTESESDCESDEWDEIIVRRRKSCSAHSRLLAFRSRIRLNNVLYSAPQPIEPTEHSLAALCLVMLRSQ